ncbi:hypothetical protein DTO006G1_5921 [Penicillium roqueforti]|uniref:uncharacterized protein n=1 Tax=Penicillium roqueforti TaxID=5082 RepID=UPI00190C46BC|nr:uncharacterized protein LCP9604111_4060 [Penicillium roqueforti]KAF9249960.1 hypothetical protein LCP9604111_4060 [Penicillium roqueforti]KAI1837181.1 hypothetical protein CBS147337_2433 [Penicillium roqueforti]KAI2684819.1 hypothetical protein LCP963914a_4911 [Penicillium roqueforti]KAI2704600.1 hypothetical protein CBS147372_3069 [Penicillium roqueforti]KAI2715524.1 hypothetical protein CBS147318_6124 [Penicillium roqueforti]
MKATTANLTSLPAKEQAKRVCLEIGKKSLDETMQKARSRLEKFDIFILKSHQIDFSSIIDGDENLKTNFLGE